jgi:hypothetical protein
MAHLCLGPGRAPAAAHGAAACKLQDSQQAGWKQACARVEESG